MQNNGESVSDVDESENMDGFEEYMEEMKRKEIEGRSRSQSTSVSMNGGFLMNTGLMGIFEFFFWIFFLNFLDFFWGFWIFF